MMFFSRNPNGNAHANDDLARLKRRIGNIFDEYEPNEPQSREPVGPAGAAPYQMPGFPPTYLRAAPHQHHYIPARSPYVYASRAAGPENETNSGWVLKPVPREERPSESQYASGRPRFRMFIRDPSEEQSSRLGETSQLNRKQLAQLARAMFGDRAHVEEEDEEEEESEDHEDGGKQEKSSDQQGDEHSEENELSQRILEELIKNLGKETQSQNLSMSHPSAGLAPSAASSSSSAMPTQLVFTTDAAGQPALYAVPASSVGSVTESHKRQAPSSSTKSATPLHLQMDIWEEDSAYIIEVDMPGIEKSAVSVGLDEGVLTISAERHKVARTEEKKDEFEANVESSSAESVKSSFLRNERSFGELRRSVQLPKDVDTSSISAKFDEKLSVLRVTLQKKSEITKQFISIE